MTLRVRKDAIIASDSDSDDGDILLTGGTAFSATSRRSKRSSRNDPQAQRAKRLKDMKTMVQHALQSGEEKMKEQDRLDEIHQRDSALPASPLALAKTDRTPSAAVASKMTETESECAIQDPEILWSVEGMLGMEQKDTKQTLCLGSRSTLQMSIPTMAASAPWSTLYQAMEDLKAVLISSQGIRKDKRKHQQKRSDFDFSGVLFAGMMTPKDLSFFLGTMQLCHLESSTVQRLPLKVLQWMFTMACAPTAAVAASSDKVDPLLTDAQLGAFQTLYRLWTSSCGYPKEGFLLNLSSLPTQLRQWFGLTLGRNDPSAEDDKKATLSSKEAVLLPARDAIVPSSTFATRINQFLQLWSVALQRGMVYCNESDEQTFMKCASCAIIAVLWAGLDPTFGSSNSSSSVQDNGILHIQAIVACLLKMVHMMTTKSSRTVGSVEPLEAAVSNEYSKWIERLAQEIFTVWSERLGRGPKGTDAFDDTRAWLSLSRTVRNLALSNMMNQPSTDSDNQSSSTIDLEFALSRCMVCHAFGSSALQRTETIDHWLSTALNQTMDSWETPCRRDKIHLRAQGAWQALALVSVALSKLAEDFPEDSPSTCLSIVEISAVCFHMGLRELHTGILLKCQDDSREKREQDDDSKLNDSDDLEAEIKWGKKAMAAFLQNVELSCHNISVITRRRSMNNVCFPRASLLLECIRGFARLQKAPFETAKAAPKHQAKLDAFLSRSCNPLVEAVEN